MARAIRLRTGSPLTALYTLVRPQAQSRANSSVDVQPRMKISYCSRRTLKSPVAGLYNDPRLVIPGIDGIAVRLLVQPRSLHRAACLVYGATSRMQAQNTGPQLPNSLAGEQLDRPET
jgi:hypothetical protein